MSTDLDIFVKKEMDNITEIKIENIETLIKVEVDENIVVDEEMWNAKQEIEIDESEKYSIEDPLIRDRLTTKELNHIEWLTMKTKSLDSMKGKYNSSDKTGSEIYEEKYTREKKDLNENETCPKCFKIFDSKYNVKRHVRTQHERKGRLECDKCDKSFASDTALKYHMRIQHPEDSEIHCGKCDAKFSDLKSYVDHKTMHGSFIKIKQKCEECDAVICGKGNMNRHIREVHRIEVRLNIKKTEAPSFPHKCDECRFVTKRKFDLRVHNMQKHSGDNKMMHACQNCEKTYRFKSSLRRHEKQCTKNSGSEV
eukprot:GFUD01005723.1.p1 GENE.GFUD01005723.1~~GFUD01005723.1.p1  ORF type:complete len:310 (+),score=80.33 GFUD01005723.1:57-986(+)